MLSSEAEKVIRASEIPSQTCDNYEQITTGILGKGMVYLHLLHGGSSIDIDMIPCTYVCRAPFSQLSRPGHALGCMYLEEKLGMRSLMN